MVDGEVLESVAIGSLAAAVPTMISAYLLLLVLELDGVTATALQV